MGGAIQSKEHSRVRIRLAQPTLSTQKIEPMSPKWHRILAVVYLKPEVAGNFPNFNRAVESVDDSRQYIHSAVVIDVGYFDVVKLTALFNDNSNDLSTYTHMDRHTDSHAERQTHILSRSIRL